jgi:ABC-type transporter Mla maintaining outer membrane lipid asymmetry ATPase subunit MlaF
MRNRLLKRWLLTSARPVLVIIGQSGAGKTTLLRLTLGIVRPNEGAVFFKQHKVSRMNDHELEQIRMRIGMVYQDAALLSSLTVRENLALPLQELTDETPSEIDRIVDEKLEMLRRGKIIEQGTPDQLKQSKNPVVVQFLSGSAEGPILERSKCHMLSPAD